MPTHPPLPELQNIEPAKVPKEKVTWVKDLLECRVFFVPVVMIETGLKRSGDGTREEAHT
jgi:hypothetical protein